LDGDNQYAFSAQERQPMTAIATEPRARRRTTKRPPVEPEDQATAWARAVVAGEVICGRLVRLAAERHLRDLERAAAGAPIRWDAERAERAVRFFTKLKHSKGKWAGQAFTLAPWQAFIVGSLFGWLNLDGTRRFREAYEEVPRKNGKSTKDAGIALLLAFFDGEAGAEVYVAATKREQAKIVWGEAKKMVEQTELRKRITVLQGNLSRDGSKLEPLGADADSTDGLNIHSAIVDELHAHKTSAMVDVLRTATGARTQPLIKYVTTSGKDRNSVCWQMHEYGRQILEGTIEDDSVFVFIACADEGDDYREELTWRKANPNYGISVNPDDLRVKARRAENMTSARHAFLQLHLNIWPHKVETWLPMEQWNAPASAADLASTAGRRVYVGIDMASPRDLVCAALVWEPDAAGVIDVALRAWIPEVALSAEDGDQSERQRALQAWVDDGLIEKTEGNRLAAERIADDLVAEIAQHDLGQIGLNAAVLREIDTRLQQDFGEDQVVNVNYGFPATSAACKDLEARVAGGKLRHGGHPLLRYTAEQVATERGKDEQIRIDRDGSAEKVAVSALVAALAVLSRAIPQESSDDDDWSATWV
jgi:phage terminase large subunit-like protein